MLALLEEYPGGFQVIKERRLGRGLEALLGRTAENPEASQEPAAGQLVQLSVYEIDSNPFQPRVDFGEHDLQGLADSIKEHGLLQPVVVRRVDDRHQLVAGERRLRAAIKAGYDQVPAQVLEADDRQMAELAIVENLQRKDLNPLEKAASFQQYLNRYGGTQDELAARLSVDRTTVTNLIRLLELPGEVQQAVRTGALRQGHARALLPLGDEPEQVALARRIQEQGLSVRAVEELVQQHHRRGRRGTAGRVRGRSPGEPRGRRAAGLAMRTWRRWNRSSAAGWARASTCGRPAAAAGGSSCTSRATKSSNACSASCATRAAGRRPRRGRGRSATDSLGESVSAVAGSRGESSERGDGRRRTATWHGGRCWHPHSTLGMFHVKHRRAHWRLGFV